MKCIRVRAAVVYREVLKEEGAGIFYKSRA